MKQCFYCENEGAYVVDDGEAMFFLCKKHYRLFLAKYGQKQKKNKDE